jgi:hypothetical protein
MSSGVPDMLARDREARIEHEVKMEFVVGMVTGMLFGALLMWWGIVVWIG